MTNNLVDIITFESLRSDQQTKTGMSSVLVSNAIFVVEDKKKAEANKQEIEWQKQRFIEEEQFLMRTKSELEKKKTEFEKLEKLQQAINQKQQTIDKARRKAVLALSLLYQKRVHSRSNLCHRIKEFKECGIVATSTELNDDDGV
jgi:acyl-CoA reductase-like NAD-dependent aldehyde dehydrogenase